MHLSCVRKILPLVVLACALAGMAPNAAVAATKSSPGLTVPAASIGLVDGQGLWARKAGTRRHVASTIKMLNALVVRERAELDDVVVVTAKAARTESGVGLVSGQKITVRKLLQLMLVVSSNDAAEALAIGIAGSEKKYVALMNAKAKKMGLTGTHAVDPHGLSKKETSTPRDLSVLATALLADPVLRRTVRLESVVLERPHMKPKRLEATNKLLGHYQGIEGVKTGFTYAAGYCLVGAAKRGNLELVGVVLGARSSSSRFSQMHKLLDWGFARYRMRRLVSVDTTMGVVRVSSGSASSVTVHAAREESRAVIATGIAIVTEVILPATLPAPISKGDQLGVVRVTQGGMPLASVGLLADSSVATVATVPTPTPVVYASNAGHASSLWERLGDLPRRVLVALASGI